MICNSPEVVEGCSDKAKWRVERRHGASYSWRLFASTLDVAANGDSLVLLAQEWIAARAGTRGEVLRCHRGGRCNPDTDTAIAIGRTIGNDVVVPSAGDAQVGCKCLAS